MQLSLDPKYGWVVLTAVGSTFVHHFYLASKVMAARKKYNVKYPKLYADPKEPNGEAFNCVQRGHQNALELQPQFLMLLLTAGLEHPVTSSVLGVSYLIGRIIYFAGYATGNPDARLRGAPFMYPGLLGLMGIAIKLGVDLIRKA